MANEYETKQGRLPPSDVQAEAEILCDCLLYEDRRNEIVSECKAEWFYADAHKFIFEAIVALSAEGKPVDLISVRTRLIDNGKIDRIGSKTYLAELADATPTRSDATQLVERIRDKWRVRQAIATCQQAVAEGYGPIDDTQKYLDGIEQSIFDIGSERVLTSQPTDLGIVVRQSMNNLADYINDGAANRVMTGITQLDDVIMGMRPGNLIILAARPGIGKTSMGLCIAANVAGLAGILNPDREPQSEALVFSMEMSKQELSDKLVCAIAKIDSKKMAQPDKLTREDWDSMVRSMDVMTKLPLVIDDESAITIASIRAKARRVASIARARGRELRLIVVDYLQLMGVNKKLDIREQQVSENSRGLKAAAKDLGVPIICLSQLNRESTKSKEPGLEHLRESGAIEQDADQVWFLHEDPEDGDGVMQVIVKKGRQYGGGRAFVAWQKKYGRFDSLSEAASAECWRDFNERKSAGKGGGKKRRGGDEGE